MPFNGSGVFSRIYNWATDAGNSIPMTPSRFDQDANDMAAGLSNCMTRNGQSVLTANLPMGGFKLTGLAAGIAAGDSISYDQISGSGGASVVGFLQAGTAAVPRTLQDKARDTVSTKDFGAVGDFNFGSNTGTDDTAAINAALAYCSANNKRLLQVGVSKLTSALTWPTTQVDVIGAGAARTFDSGWAYRGTGVMVTGQGVDKAMPFSTLTNMVFDGPGIGSGVDGFYGDFYEGGMFGCVLRNWRTAVQCFGSLNTFKHNRFVGCVSGLIVTNWPAGSSQAGTGTTTFLSERNDYFGCTGFGLKFDTSGTGGLNFVSSTSDNDTFEQNGVGLYCNKSFSLKIIAPHFELSTTWALQAINSAITLIAPYYSGTDASKISITFPGASANTGGYCQVGTQGANVGGLLGNSLTLSTQAGHDVTLTPLDNGHLVFASIALDISASPVVFGVNQLAGSAVSLAAAAGAPGLATFANTTVATSAVLFQNTNGTVGSVSTSGTATAYNTSSDIRLKSNIEAAPLGAFGSVIDQIEIVSHDFKADGAHVRAGVIAQHLQKVLPEAVTAGDDDPDEITQTWGVDLKFAIPMLINEIQSLRARLQAAEIA